jgi:hypothetical protein
MWNTIREVREMSKKRKTLPAHVRKIIESNGDSMPEKAEIEIHDGDELYREIRIENEVTDDKGRKAALKQGDDVDVIVETDSDPTLRKPARDSDLGG